MAMLNWMELPYQPIKFVDKSDDIVAIEIIHLDQSWPEGNIWKTAANDQSADDVRSPRDSIPRYQFEEDRRLAEAAAGD